ncbi:MAG: SsrA-binding protein SmpB [Candidatus Omnitrophica bacterium]|nr:SsrA-binding protein SmpB [Candidatus Omnitrophota bacterium]
METSVIATNKRAGIKYELFEKLETGIELKGTEVKSLRLHHADLKDSFARVEKSEVILYQFQISPYEKGSYNNVEPCRPRRLLLHRREISRLSGKMAQRGFTLIPLSVYFNSRGKVKVQLAVGKGRRVHDQREKIKKREMEQQLRKAVSLRR